jgi:Domain of unknown function (DUF4129)
MRSTRHFWIVLVLALLSIGASADEAPPLSLSQYKNRLEELIQVTDEDHFDSAKVKAAAESLPDKWIVEQHGQSFEIPVQSFKRALLNVKDEDDSALDEVHDRLQELFAQAKHFDDSAVDATAERTKLTEILSRQEFRAVHSPNWYDRLKARVTQWLFDLISRVFGAAAFPTASRIIVWSLVILAVAVLAFMVYRTIKNNARLESPIPAIPAISAKSWSLWMAEANAAAARGDWREAIHLSYWAGISLLESRGLWRADRARTPREYVRLLPPDNASQPLLRQLTQRFELTWYGYKSADEQSFHESLADLEKLGCR